MEVTTRRVISAFDRSIGLFTFSVEHNILYNFSRVIVAKNAVKKVAEDGIITRYLCESCMEQSAKELLSIVSDDEIVDLILSGKFPEYTTCIEVLKRYHDSHSVDIFIERLKSNPVYENIKEQLKIVINNEVTVQEDINNEVLFKLRCSLVRLSFQKIKTLAGEIHLVSTSVQDTDKEKIATISSRINEYIKEKKEKENITYIFSDSSGSRTFSKLNLNLTDLKVKEAINPRTGNLISIKFS